MADLRVLKQKMEERKKLLSRQAQVQKNIATMEAMLPGLDVSRQEEQEDVERMESGGITSFFYSVIGKQEEKLEKERQEAWEAETKYLDALRTLQELYKENEDLTSSIAVFGDLENRYRQAFSQKRQQLLASSTSSGQRLRDLEEDARQLKGLQREVQEAKNAGNQVMDQIDRIENALRSASNWGMVDMFSDSFLSDVAKYSKMDEAQAELKNLNRLLQAYARELRDLNVHMNISADLGSGMRMADILFDNISTDSSARSRIDGIRRQVSQFRYQVEQHRALVDKKELSVTETLAQKRREAEWVIIDG